MIRKGTQNAWNDHEGHAPLCALASSGALTAEEWRMLARHVKLCTACRQALTQYQEIANFGMALIAPRDVSLDVETEWSPEAAVAKLMSTLESGEGPCVPTLPAAAAVSRWERLLGGITLVRLSPAVRYAAAVLLFAAVLIATYGVLAGSRRQTAAARTDADLALSRQRSFFEQRLQSNTAEIARLSRELQYQKAAARELEAQHEADHKMRDQRERQFASQKAENATLQARVESLQNENIEVAAKRRDSEARIAALQQSLDKMGNQHVADLLQKAKLEADIASMAQRPRPTEVVEARETISEDPDLRALMGARDLFIADVYDIDKSGRRQRPFGRIFYTRNKELLFYAFDLQEQPDARPTSTFQVWGRRGYGDTHPVNMGAMYLDSKISNRWVLIKDCNARALSQVDAVFVTIEPRGGSKVPKGRQLLYASLRNVANHP
jgi:CRP-like cAMP-binding protein